MAHGKNVLAYGKNVLAHGRPRRRRRRRGRMIRRKIAGCNVDCQELRIKVLNGGLYLTTIDEKETIDEWGV